MITLITPWRVNKWRKGPSQRVSNEKNDSIWWCNHVPAGPLFTKRTHVLPQDPAKCRSCEFGCYNYRIAQKCNSHLGSAAADVPVKSQSDWIRLNPKLAASRLHEILRQDVCPLTELRPRSWIHNDTVSPPVSESYRGEARKSKQMKLPIM